MAGRSRLRCTAATGKVGMVDMTDMDGCKRYYSDKEDCKEFEALEIGNMDETDSYR